MPEEILILSVIAISASTFIITRLLKVWMAHVSSRSSATTPSGASLTSGELEQMLMRVSEEANAPLLARIESLERRLTTPAPRLPSPAQTLLLDEPEQPQDLAGTLASSRGRRSVT
ncbi:MAG: hypothetical protein SH809_03435 [Rhodothermales bacterium]|nr:hypothetical protein [Rhodothermales bacterium]